MSDYKWGHCEYCGRYRPLKWNGGYCSEWCYDKSGQGERDAKNAAWRHAIMYERDDFAAVRWRTSWMAVYWFLLTLLMQYIQKVKDIPGGPFLFIWRVANSLGGIPGIIMLLIVGAVVSLLQNFMMRGRGENFRRFIMVGIPVIVGLLSLTVFPKFDGIAQNVAESREEKAFIKSAEKEFKKTYTKDANIIVEQKFITYEVDRKTGEVIVTDKVFFTKKGISHGSDKYTIDTATRTITSIDEDGEKYMYRYWEDGNAFYSVDETGAAGSAKVKAGATFNQESASEVVGKTFRGTWSDGITATITFGNDGKASVKFSDGDTATGSYIADAESNIVMYNHRDKGVWHQLTYADDSSTVLFRRLHTAKQNNSSKYYSSSIKTEIHKDWKKQ